MSEVNLVRIQLKENYLARMVAGTHRCDHNKPLLTQLHSKSGIQDRYANSLHNQTDKATAVLRGYDPRYEPHRILLSTSQVLLKKPTFKIAIGCRSSRYVAAKTWNRLPETPYMTINTLESGADEDYNIQPTIFYVCK